MNKINPLPPPHEILVYFQIPFPRTAPNNKISVVH